MTIDIADGLRGIGVCASREALLALLAHATKGRLSPAQVVEQLVLLERRERDTRNLASRTKKATLGAMKPLDRFDWSFPRKIDRPRYEQLHQSLGFTARGENVLLRGPSGVGKSTLAQNLGQRALETGKSVCFATVNGALADLLKQESLPAVERRMKRYTTPDVLLLDELGYLPCDARSGDLLYSIIGRRHERASTIITTNLAFKDWGTVFPGAACVAALVDRFTQHCHVLDIEGESWRQRPDNSPDGAPATAPTEKPRDDVKKKEAARR
jgi:DNA replication protein DnaC